VLYGFLFLVPPGLCIMRHAVVTTSSVPLHNVPRGDIPCFEALCVLNGQLCFYSFCGTRPGEVLSIIIVHCEHG
jgi:hypothetical protein